MLIRFYVANFLSFADKTEFSMISAKGAHADDHVVRSNGFGVLRGAVLYGANASGKSNLVNAIDLARHMVTDSAKTSSKLIDKRFRPASSDDDTPTHFEFEFSVAETVYAYGFTFSPTAVHEEWLYVLRGSGEIVVFERDDTGFHLNESLFRGRDSVKRLEYMFDDLLPTQLYLTEANTRNIKNISGAEPLIESFRWFMDSLVIIYPESRFRAWDSIEQDTAFVDAMNRKLREFDTGIDRVSFEERAESDIPETELPRDFLTDIESKAGQTSVFVFGHDYNTYLIDWPDGKRRIRELCTIHETQSGPEMFRMADESDGTKRLTDFIPLYIRGTAAERTFIIDEIDRSLHTNLSTVLVSTLLRSFAGSRSQLICTTHDTRLMDLELFRRDEIWFVEKDSSGRSRLHSLNDYRPRRDKDVQKEYLNGRYGGVPVLAE